MIHSGGMKCPHCRKTMYTAALLSGQTVVPGLVAVCSKCMMASFVDTDLSLRVPTDREDRFMTTDSDCMAHLALVRKKLMESAVEFNEYD